MTCVRLLTFNVSALENATAKKYVLDWIDTAGRDNHTSWLACIQGIGIQAVAHWKMVLAPQPGQRPPSLSDQVGAVWTNAKGGDSASVVLFDKRAWRNVPDGGAHLLCQQNRLQQLARLQCVHHRPTTTTVDIIAAQLWPDATPPDVSAMLTSLYAARSRVLLSATHVVLVGDAVGMRSDSLTVPPDVTTLTTGDKKGQAAARWAERVFVSNGVTVKATENMPPPVEGGRYDEALWADQRPLQATLCW